MGWQATMLDLVAGSPDQEVLERLRDSVKNKAGAVVAQEAWQRTNAFRS